MTVRAAAVISCAWLACACSSVLAEDAPKLSKADESAIGATMMEQVRKCWTPPAVEAGALVRIRIELDLARDGAVTGQPIASGSGSHPLTPVLTEAAIRAVRQCAPYVLPADLYGYWRRVAVTFVVAPPPPASPSPQ